MILFFCKKIWLLKKHFLILWSKTIVMETERRKRSYETSAKITFFALIGIISFIVIGILTQIFK